MKSQPRMQNAKNMVTGIAASRIRIQMVFQGKERVEAERLKNPERFMRNLLGDFPGKSTRQAQEALGRNAKRVRVVDTANAVSEVLPFSDEQRKLMRVLDLKGLITPLPLDASGGVSGRERCLNMYEEQKKFASGPAGPVPAERRTHPRYPCTAAAEITDLGSGAKINARTSDIGRGGCYVDTINPFPVGAAVKVRLTKDNQSFAAQAKVAYTMPGLGMGLAFTSADPEQLWTLQHWINELGRISGPEPEARAPEPAPKVWSAPEKNAKNMQYYVLNELIISLMSKGVLSDAEGKAMLEKLLR